MNNHEESILINKLKSVKTEIINLSEKIIYLKKQKINLENECFNTCHHSFVKIENVTSDDLCKQICSKCECYNISFIYNKRPNLYKDLR
mgnify:CR=1 FL=1|jgi:hypothetical protein